MKGKQLALIGIGVAVAVAVGVTAAVNSMDATSPPPDDSAPDQGLPALQGEITVGSILPLTGDLATHGEENMEGTRLRDATEGAFSSKGGAVLDALQPGGARVFRIRV